MATAWDISTAEYANKSKSVDWEPHGVTFNPDGSKMYITSDGYNTVYQYTLSTPWDVSTATYAEKSKDLSAQIYSQPFGIAFSSDGSKMYIMGGYYDTVYQYTLSTPWDVSTASYAEKSKSVNAQDGLPYDVDFNPDGSKMYIVGDATDTVYQYTLSTPWDVSTASYAEKLKDVSTQDGYPHGVAFSSNGSKMYIMGYITDTVYQYTLSTGWDVSTATYAEKSKDVSAQETAPEGVAFSPDGSKMYVVGRATDTVYQYTLPVPPVVTNALFFGNNF